MTQANTVDGGLLECQNPEQPLGDVDFFHYRQSVTDSSLPLQFPACFRIFSVSRLRSVMSLCVSYFSVVDYPWIPGLDFSPDGMD